MAAFAAMDAGRDQHGRFFGFLGLFQLSRRNAATSRRKTLWFEHQQIFLVFQQKKQSRSQGRQCVVQL